jgi:hypothetical protein
MNPRDSAVTITENSIIQRKIASERVLTFALNLGLLLPEHYKYMLTIGKSKQVGDLMKDLSIPDLATIRIVLRRMLRRGIIAVEEKTSPVAQ